MKQSTIVAFAVLVLLVGLVYWLETEDGSDADVERVFHVAEEDIERVEILRPESEPTVIERHGEAFRIVRPVDAATDPREVELILSNLATMTVVRSFERDDDADIDEFGLATPKLEVRFAAKNGTEGVIHFGKDTLTPSNQYAERGGKNEVLVVAAHIASNLDKSAWDLRDKAVFHLPEDAEPERVTIVHASGEITELAKTRSVWMTARPPSARVDRFAVTGMVARFRRAEMLTLATAEEDSGIDPPTHRVDVTFEGDADPLSLEIGNERNVDYYARVPNEPSHVFLIEGGLVDELRASTSDWWSKKLLHHATSENTMVRIVTSDDDRSLDRERAQTLLRALSDATADEVVARVPAGDPAYVITVTTDALEDEISIRLDGEIALATRRAEDVTLRLPPDAWAAIEAQLTTDG